MPRRIFTFKNKRNVPPWLAWLAACIVRVVAWTYRVRYTGPKPVEEMLGEEPQVIAIGHNRLLFLPAIIPTSVLRKCTVLISASRDGGYISAFIRFFGMNIVRGSSSRGAMAALLGLLRAVENGSSPVLTVDGPRGPKYGIHQGVVAIARKKNIKVIPLMLNAKRKWQLRSWDRLQIPWPFSLVELVVGEPFRIPEELSLDDACRFVQERLLAITVD